MKKVLIILLLFSIAVSAKKRHVIINGKKAIIKETCLKSHSDYERVKLPIIKGNSYPYEIVNVIICDSIRYDTVYKQNKF